MAEPPPSGPGWNVRTPRDAPYGSPLPPGTPVAPPPAPPTPAQPPPLTPPQPALAPPAAPWGGQADWTTPPPPPSPAGGGKRMAVVGAVLAVLVAGGAAAIMLTRGNAPLSPAAVAASHGSTPTPAQQPTDPPATSAAGVTAFADPDGYFSASFSNTPVRDTSSLTLGNQSIPYTQWTNVVDANVIEVVAYANYPGSLKVETPNAVLSGSLAGFASLSKGTLASKTFGTFEGFSDADGVVVAPGGAGFAEVRVILAGHTLFEVVASGLDNPPAGFHALASSFTILKHTP